MLAGILFVILLLTAIYGAIILGLILLLRRLGVKPRWAIVLGFLVYGAASAVLAAWAWPLDSSVYPNLYATLLGDRVYQLAIQYLGDPGSAQAHETSPWFLRVPQVYVLTSLVLCGLGGLVVQGVYHWRSERDPN